VTKPGLAPVSSAYAVELFIGILHHPKSHAATADHDPDKYEKTAIGILPQHIRGSMGRFQNQIFCAKSF